MIVTADEIMALPEFAGQSKIAIEKKLKAIELLIRAYTNNNFQNRFVRFGAASSGKCLLNTSRFLEVGDTIQISQSGVNDGLYTVTEIANEHICVDAELFDTAMNVVTKVEYPVDVQQGAINLMKWEVASRGKVGIKSETLSRHSVTYFDLDASNQVMGYPVSLLGFLKPYMKARF